MQEPVPPSEPPRPTSVTNNPEQPVGEKTLRIHVFAAGAAALVLVGGALYLWRRPASTPAVEVNATNSLAATPPGTPAAGAPAPGTPGARPALPGATPPSGAKAASQPAALAPPVGGPSLSEVRLVSCHDKGSKKTAPEECDHLKPLEEALIKAVRDSADCLPDDASSASIEYVADVSFSKKRVRVLVPSAHRSVKQKTAARCAKSVKKLLADLPLTDVDHQHAQYKLAVTATYSKR